MVNHARRNGIAVDVGHQVGANHHGYILLIEGVDHSLQRVLVLVHVIAVELHHKLASLFMMSSQIPVAANAHIIIVGNDMDKARIIIFGNSLAGAVGREVVNHHEVELEVGLLTQHAVDSVANGAYAVAHRNHHCSLHFKLVMVKLNVLEIGNFLAIHHLGGSQITANFLQMLGAGCLHLDLTATIAWINIVKNLLAALAGVELHIAIKEFVDVANVGKLRELETQVIESGKLIVGLHGCGGLLETATAEEVNRAKVEVIAQTTELVVDHGSLDCPTLGHIIVVGIEHACLRVVGKFHKALHCKGSEFERIILVIIEHIVGIGMLSNCLHRARSSKVLHFDDFTTINSALRVVGCKQKDFTDQFFSLQVLNGEFCLFGICKRNEAVNSSHNSLKFLLLLLIDLISVIC